MAGCSFILMELTFSWEWTACSGWHTCSTHTQILTTYLQHKLPELINVEGIEASMHKKSKSDPGVVVAASWRSCAKKRTQTAMMSTSLAL